MADSESELSPELEAFLEAVTGRPSRARTEAFLAAIRGEGYPAGDASFAAAGLSEQNFNPDEPRDERGRWTTGGAGPSGSQPPEGTRENGYDGLGRWELRSREEAIQFFRALLNPPHGGIPDVWLRVLERGCVGLNLLRIGTTGVPGPMKNALFLKGASLYSGQAAAEAGRASLSAANPGAKYALFAAQIPTAEANGSRIQRALDAQFGKNAFTVKDIPPRLLHLDLSRMADFNFATAMPKGYWEYMNRGVTFDNPKKPPAVIHGMQLPDLGKEYITIYGVTKKQPLTN